MLTPILWQMQGENPDRPQLNLKPFNGRLGGARSSAQGGVTWRDPKGVGVRKPDNGNANPRNDGNGHNRLEFSVILCSKPWTILMAISSHRALKDWYQTLLHSVK
jgi:hypothetical protein